MSHRLAIGLVIASMIFMAPRPAAAAITPTVFDTVDSVEAYYQSEYTLTVKGILAGGTTPTTHTFNFYNSSGGSSVESALAERCERFAVLAMSKPGKYQLSITWEASGSDKINRGCKLILRAP
jgi:hypothetical protein